MDIPWGTFLILVRIIMPAGDEDMPGGVSKSLSPFFFKKKIASSPDFSSQLHLVRKAVTWLIFECLFHCIHSHVQLILF